VDGEEAVGEFPGSLEGGNERVLQFEGVLQANSILFQLGRVRFGTLEIFMEHLDFSFFLLCSTFPAGDLWDIKLNEVLVHKCSLRYYKSKLQALRLQ
jgi:hypothetical protein